jgi:glycosyltransferase involved in cell wall biosynthesis
MLVKSVNVSIVMANFNNGRYLVDFIESVMHSTVTPKELIIIDDGSTDNSLQILKKYIHLPFLKLIEFEKNRGFCNALNAGIELASGDFILRVDPDDIILKNRIEAQVAFLEKHHDVDVVSSNVIYFDGNTGKELITSNFPVSHQAIYQEYFNGDHGVLHATTLIRADVLKQYRYNQNNYLAEDYELFARMISDGHRFSNIKEALVKVRIHGDSAATNINYQTIQKTFQLRDEIFGTSTSVRKIRFYYWYMLNYRRFLLSDNLFYKPVFLVLAVLAHPGKLLKRLF